MSFIVKVEVSIDEHTRRLMDDGLDEYNIGKVGEPDNSENLWVVARDKDGTVQGGIKARSYYSWLFIDWLWVSPSARGAGIGSQLMNLAEATARERGCIGAYVDTFSFQAPKFYKSRGYEEFGRIEDFPPNHACIWLRKSLSQI